MEDGRLYPIVLLLLLIDANLHRFTLKYWCKLEERGSLSNTTLAYTYETNSVGSYIDFHLKRNTYIGLEPGILSWAFNASKDLYWICWRSGFSQLWSCVMILCRGLHTGGEAGVWDWRDAGRWIGKKLDGFLETWGFFSSGSQSGFWSWVVGRFLLTERMSFWEKNLTKMSR